MAALRKGARRAAFALFLALAAMPGGAQQADDPALRSPIVTVDQERLFSESAYGQSLIDEIEAASEELAAENRNIEADLIAEERALTEARATLDPETFRKRAAAFDEKVVAIRKQQDEKARDLVRQRETAREDFYRRILPILTDIVRERGAVAVMESRAVILSADRIDITDEAIARIDAAFAPDDAPPANSAPSPPPDRDGAADGAVAPGIQLPPGGQ